MSQIQKLTSKITQVCNDIHGIQLRRLLVTQSKHQNNDDVSLMNTEWPNAFWNRSLAPTKKNGGAEPVEELEMREGIGLMKGAEYPC